MSDLLNSASLVMIPSGYKEDVVYSQIPTDGSGDLAFTRASNGTRVNSAGLVEVCPWNLAQYSEEFNNAVYVVKNAVTIVDNSTTAPNGTTTADLIYPNSSGDFRYVAQAFTQAENIYTLSVYAKAQNKNVIWMYIESSSATGIVYFDLSDGTMSVTAGSSSTPIGTMTAVGNGWYRCTYTVGASLSLVSGSGFGVCDAKGNVYATASGTNGVYFWGYQLNIGATAKPYFPTTDRLNVPRLTYQNGGGGCPSLLLEKQSTNYALSSEDFSNTTYWTASGSMTVTANQTTSPDGTQNADLFYNSGAVYKFVAAPVSSYYSFSCYFKRVDVTTVKITASDFYSGDVEGSFNLVALTSSSAITGDWSNNTTKIESIGNGWYRCTVTALRGSGGSGVAYRVECAESAKSFYAWGYQCEASYYPTSYIPTTSSSATRVADACVKTGISALFGTNQGTFFIDFVYYGSEQFCYIFDVTDASNVNRFLMYDSNGSGLFYFYDNGYSVIDAYQFTKGQRYKIAVKYNSSGTVWYVNGVLKGTGTVSFAHQMSQLYLGIRYSYTDNTGMTVNESIVFPTALSGTELISLTTI